MLALSKKISCECLRVGVLVGDDQYFARTGNKVDANLSVALALGLSDVLVAGTDNHVDRKNALGTIGERCNGLHAAESVDFVRAGEIHGDKCFVVDRSGAVRDRRTSHDTLDSRNLGRSDEHHGRGVEREAPARDIAAARLHGDDAMAE